MKLSSHNFAATIPRRPCVAPCRARLHSHFLWPPEPTTRIAHQTPQSKAPIPRSAASPLLKTDKRITHSVT